MKPRDLLDENASVDNAADPLAELEAILEAVQKDVSRGDKLTLIEQCARLLARAPLGAVDVYAAVIREKLNATKDTLVLAVHTARTTRSAASADGSAASFEPTAEDIAAAESVLKSPQIEGRFLAAMARLGVVGEALNLMLLLLTIVSRLLNRPICLVLKSASSAGKSFLMNMVLSILPPGECIVFTAASAKALYFRTDSLAHKVLVFMERPGAETNDYQVRILQSEGKLVYSVAEKDPETGQIVTVDREIEGPVAYIETTTEPVLHDENETRLFSASLDESADATSKIIVEQGRRAASRNADDANEVLTLWRTVHTLLKPADVVIPFAEKIATQFPSRVVRARRDFPRFLSLIEASAILYQHQRERDGGTVVATIEDYALARRLAAPLLETAILGANRKTRELIAAARELAGTESPGDVGAAKITANKMSKRLSASGWSKQTVRRHLKAAEEAGYLDLVHAQKGQEYEYRVTVVGDDICLALPSPEELAAEPRDVEVCQVEQGVPNADGTLNPNESSEMAEVYQPSQEGGGQVPLFDPKTIRGLRDPDCA